tara:strand:+ start:386 stop:682 length:297 start_codon:yes stop_codon:yes gene_type:complete
MIKVGKNVWVNFFDNSSFSAPNGWLLDPKKRFLIHFIVNRNSSNKIETVLTQLWYASELLTPNRLKNTRNLNLRESCETWNELVSNGWKFVEYGELVA